MPGVPQEKVRHTTKGKGLFGKTATKKGTDAQAGQSGSSEGFSQPGFAANMYNRAKRRTGMHPLITILLQGSRTYMHVLRHLLLILKPQCLWVQRSGGKSLSAILGGTSHLAGRSIGQL